MLIMGGILVIPHGEEFLYLHCITLIPCPGTCKGGGGSCEVRGTPWFFLLQVWSSLILTSSFEEETSESPHPQTFSKEPVQGLPCWLSGEDERHGFDP